MLPPPSTLNRLTPLFAALLVACGLAGPAAAQLVIPPITGPAACTEGGLSELNPTRMGSLSTPTNTGLSVNVPGLTRRTVTGWHGLSQNSFDLRIAVQENQMGSTVSEEKTLGIVSSGSFLNAQTVTFSSLKKNTRYVVSLYRAGGPTYSRSCFKTRGEFTNAEQNLVFDGFEWQPNLA